MSPVLLSSPDEVTSFLEGDLYQRHAAVAPVTVLGLFSSTADAGSVCVCVCVALTNITIMN